MWGRGKRVVGLAFYWCAVALSYGARLSLLCVRGESSARGLPRNWGRCCLARGLPRKWCFLFSLLAGVTALWLRCVRMSRLVVLLLCGERGESCCVVLEGV